MNYNQIAELENKGEYVMAINELYKEWQENESDGKLLVRLSFECWYVLSERYRFNLSEAECEKAKNILIQVKHKVLDSEIKDSYVLSHLGYMMTMFPEFFYNGEDEEMYEKHRMIGAKILKEAVEISPDNKIAELFMLGQENKEKAYNKLKKQLKLQIKQEYVGTDCFDEYFRDVLTQE